MSPDGRIKSGSQTSYMLALAFDLLPADKREAAAGFLVENIKGRDMHLSTGFNGTAYLMPTLAADRPQRRRLPAPVERHVPLVGLLDQARGHHHLGTVGRLDRREGFSGPRHELVRPLLVRRGRPMDVPDRGGHRHRRAGVPAVADRPDARPGAHLGQGRVRFDPRPDRQRVADRRTTSS